MRHRVARFFFASGIGACAVIAACSLQDGGVLAFDDHDGSFLDATSDAAPPADSSPPPGDGSIVDAGATFCDLAVHDGGFFFCADFDDPALTHGFTEIVTDGGSIAFVASDASAPNLFEATLANPNNDSTRNANLSTQLDFPDSGDAGISYLSIAFDLRVNALAIDGAAPLTFTNMFIVSLTPLYGIYAPIFGKPNQAPVFTYGSFDFGDASLNVVDILDGGVPLGEWNRFRLMVDVGQDGGPSTLSIYVNMALVSTQVVHLPPDTITSRHLGLVLGPSATGPLDLQFDFDNVVIRSDKF